MGIMVDVPMPINCVDCDNRAIRPLIGCKLIFQGCANCGRHPNCPIVEAIPKAEYENRLKTDMVAMLKEIQLEIVEKVVEDVDYDALSTLELKHTCEVIKQKINALKAESEDV